MADDYDDYKVGPARSPLHAFPKGQSGNPGGQKKLYALLTDALNEPVFVTVDAAPRRRSPGQVAG